ncbi:MAG: hypothetical protein VX644_10865 [Planctomycetota bacterium]|nr:hypothetical protein [Planctomycetota bacterium]
MMNIRYHALLAVLLLAAPAHAQNLLTQLPEDGTSVRYLIKITGKIGDQETTGKGILGISSVGTETVDNEPCRWIEIYYETTTNKRLIKLTEKLLLPEKYCQPGQSPLAHLVKGYIQRGDRDAEPLTDALNALDSPIPVLLGAGAEVKALPKKIVDSKLGKLSCEGTQTDFTYEQKQRKISCQLQTWRNAKAPFGVVQAELTDVTFGYTTRFSMTLVLNTVLKNTRSRLPDLK